MYDVVTIGDTFLDLFVWPESAKVISSRDFPSGKGLAFDYGGKITLKEIDFQIGGSAANTAVSFARLGADIAIFSTVGDDQRGDDFIDYFQKEGIDVSFIERRSAAIKNQSIILSFGGDRTILAYHSGVDPIEYIPNKNLKTRWIYLAPFYGKNIEVENRIVELIAKNGCGLFWNPGGLQIKKGISENRHLLRLCNAIFLNKEELEKFCDRPKTTVENLMKVVYSAGAKLVVVTDGKEGAKCFDGSVFYKISTTDDKRVDATGAGDAFASSFVAAIISDCREKPQKYIPERTTIEKALKWGIVVSGSVVGQIGSQPGLLTKSEVEKRVEKLVKLGIKVYA
ncbi:MAG: ribokinase [Candidatus Berkelbacteria bacterium Athens1014_28]|uniref:Ribokinase n=1 Tax=Candidatus Berkelbacteria bacterium Athens1014_28 TaxID=2017145 RepID=A0A554LP92_9BACT|nr:MAG: ribokinase [Candidatus Berkelbacteria bacterium Athens1014_28]